MFWPPTVFKYNILPLPVNKSVVKPGEAIKYHGDYCKYVGNAADITHSLQRKLTDKDKKEHVADIVIIFDVIKNTNVPTGCHTIDPVVKIPTETKPGEYRVLKNIHVKINPFRTIDLEFYSDWFRVI